MLLIGLLALTLAVSDVSAACREGGLVKYELLFTGLWTQETFPKVYPVRRPNAEWGSVVGQTHRNDFTLFKLDEYITSELQTYVERGDTSKLTAIGQRSQIMDMFTTRYLNTGDGVGRTVIVADEERNLISFVSKITPSPDWFVGVSSANLCEEGRWAHRLRFDLHPLDGGTQRGYTFSAPRWKSDPQQTIFQITSSYPNHTADAFYYPNIDELPPIARVEIRLIQKYSKKKEVSTSSKESGIRNSLKPKMNIRPPVPGTIHRPALMPPVESNSLLDNIYESPSSTTTTISRTTTTPSNYVPTAYPRVYTIRDSGLRPWLVPKQTHSDSSMVLNDVILTTQPSVKELDEKSVADVEQNLSVEETTKQEQTTLKSFGIFHRISITDKSKLSGQQAFITSDDEDDVQEVNQADELVGRGETIDGSLYLESTVHDQDREQGSGLESEITESTTSSSTAQTIYRERTTTSISNIAVNRTNYTGITRIGDNLEGLQKVCLVSDWSEWSECSKSCGYGKKTRTRSIVKWTGDTPCPELQTDQLCGSMKLCNWNHFSLSFNSSSSVFGKGSGRRRPKADRPDVKLSPDMRPANRLKARTERRRLLLVH